MPFKEQDFGTRLGAAADAKKAALTRFKAKPAPDDPAVLARQEERAAIMKAREERAAARRIKEEAEAAAKAAREAEIAAAKAAQEEAERLERERQERERLTEEQQREAARKALRDARYGFLKTSK